MNESAPAAAAERANPVFWRVLEVARELSGRLDDELAGAELSLAKVGVLKILSEADEPLPLSELAECSNCVRSNITQLVDRLEGEGLVRRLTDPQDRRIRRAVLTAEGKKAYARGLEIVQAHERATQSALTARETAALRQALERLSP